MPTPRLRQAVLDHLDGKTAEDTALAAGVSGSTARLWIRTFRAEGVCHISGWVRRGSMNVAVYKLGPGKDKPCKTKAMTSAQYSRRFRQKLRDEGEWDTFLARRRAQHTIKLARAGLLNDPVINALHRRSA